MRGDCCFAGFGCLCVSLCCIVDFGGRFALLLGFCWAGVCWRWFWCFSCGVLLHWLFVVFYCYCSCYSVSFDVTRFGCIWGFAVIVFVDITGIGCFWMVFYSVLWLFD